MPKFVHAGNASETSEGLAGLDQLDADGNGTLDREELGRVVQILRRLRGPATDAFKGNAAQQKTAENSGKIIANRALEKLTFSA